MQYISGNRTFMFDYEQLNQLYCEFKQLSNEEFLERIPEILHFACVVSYIKQLDIEVTLGDRGIVHQLVHLLIIPDEPLIDLAEIRELFNCTMELD